MSTKEQNLQTVIKAEAAKLRRKFDIPKDKAENIVRYTMNRYVGADNFNQLVDMIRKDV